MRSGDKELCPELLSTREKRHFSKYGKLPREGLQSKNRTYFDSGDFALSAADRGTHKDAIHTGRAHPNRNSISHPSAPIPATSNVDNDANEESYKKSVGFQKSHLFQQSNIEDEEPTNEKGQDNSLSPKG